MNAYQASIYPFAASNPCVAQSDPARQDIAVCFSGGGSRALTCAWGQMIGLNSVLGDDGASLLDQTRFISSVSGGTWASVLYTFRPDSISDDDFLGDCYPPSQLYYNQNTQGGKNVSSMGAHALGKVPQNFANLTTLNPLNNVFADFIALTLTKGIALSASSKWLWQYIIGKNVLADFGLFTWADSIFKPRETPWNYANAKYFSLSPTYAAEHIFNAENAPPQNAFVYARSKGGKSACPMLIINTNVVGKNPSDRILSGPVQIPTQVSAVAAGIYGSNPCTADTIGGGSVESFAFTSALAAGPTSGAASQVSANFTRAYTLADITACSSAFYASVLAEPLQAVAAALQEKSDEDLNDHFAKFLKSAENLLTQEIRDKLSVANNQVSGVEDLVPQYNYWPVGAVSDGASANRNIEFTDGGDLENTGIGGLLAQVQGAVGNIISFVNGEEVLEMKNGQIIAAPQMAPLFGIAYDAKLGPFKPYLPNGINPFTGITDPKGFLQVFDNRHGEFDALRQGLYDANGGDAKTGPAFFRQTLTIMPNELYGISTTRSVNLLWVQNALINHWQQQIGDPVLLQKIQQGQQQGGKVEFANFPYYSTGEKICASAAETNTLAQMWAWAVSDPHSPLCVAIAQMFGEAGN